jgi:LPS O-antigen subunit length determinant protein (WzzB/FepE family)
MQQNIPESKYYQEDQIDLRKSFNMLWLKKNIIISITAAITILTGIYVFTKAPVYEATAMIEVGHYKKYNQVILVESVPVLVEKLNILFVDPVKNNKNKESSITSILGLDEVPGLFNIISEAPSNELAIDEINTMIDYLESHANITFQNVKNDSFNKLETIDMQLDLIRKRQARVLSDEGHLKDEETIVGSMRILEMIDGDLGVSVIMTLIQAKKEIILSLKDHNFVTTKIIGEIITNDNPARPKKIFITLLAFIVGFIFSIFLVKIIDAFRREENKTVV